MAPSLPPSSSQPANPKTNTTTSKKSSAYDKAFQEHLHDNNIYLHSRKSKPKNKVGLSQPRPSLSPSKFPDDAFVRFQDEHDNLGSEADVMRKIIPVISGAADIPNSGDALFNNLQSITNGDTVDAKPDFYDGTRFSDIDKKVRDELNHLIIPTKSTQRPAAPNFFLEAKAPEGGAGTAKRQAGLDGAIGARAMNALRNYGEEELSFDGNAYSMSSTYHAGTGTLQLYSHHITAPTAPGGQPEYHMTQVDGWQMTGNIDTFRRGATAFRNARDWAKHNRDQLILAANTTARQPDAGPPPEPETAVAVEAPPELETAVVVAEEQEAFDGSADLQSDAGPRATGGGNLTVVATPVEGPVVSQHLHEDEEEEAELGQGSTSLRLEPAMSLTPGVTSSFSTPGNNGASKRPRSPHSSPSSAQAQKQNLAKTRTRRIS